MDAFRNPRQFGVERGALKLHSPLNDEHRNHNELS